MENKLIFDQKIDNEKEITTIDNLKTGIYVAEIKLKDDTMIRKKFIINCY
jgi:hypothetical protein